MVMKLGKFLVAASLVAIFSTPAFAVEPSESIHRLESIIQDYAAIPSSELIKTSIDQRGPIISKLQRDLADALDSVDYEKLSSIEEDQQYYFTKLEQRIRNFVTMLQTKENLAS